MQSSWCWSGSQAGLITAYGFNLPTGRQGTQFTPATSNQLSAMAVTNGDVGLVPEPGTYALMLFGLTALLTARRRR